MTNYAGIMNEFCKEYAKVATDDECFRAHNVLRDILDRRAEDDGIVFAYDEETELYESAHIPTYDEYFLHIAPELASLNCEEDIESVTTFFESIGCTVRNYEFCFYWCIPILDVDPTCLWDACLYDVPEGKSDGLWIAEGALEMWHKARPLLVVLFDQATKADAEERFEDAEKLWDEFHNMYCKTVSDIADEMALEIQEDMDYNGKEEAYGEWLDANFDDTLLDAAIEKNND